MDDERRVAASYDLAQTLSGLAQSLQAASDTAGMLDGLVAAAATHIPGVDEASISVVQARRLVVSEHPSSELAALVDAVQVEVGEGPCLDALHEERMAWVPDVAQETRWPQFAGRAAEVGVGSVMAFQLAVEGEVLGTLNLYACRPHAFGEESEQVGLLFASHAAVAMAAARDRDHLMESLASRDLVGQAKGILMERYKIGSVEAFALLVRVSQHTNTKLRNVAAELARTGQFGQLPDETSQAS
ncbi:GAF domain-containing protein [Friedmanniella luteola]|uniref:GAF domain-containing protein n=1 Tax=Friedmanniella luteola TaxID=546871 RepID=A0A1H1XPA0_9ACTN|nr:GAF and ANTAR domain-containing protein [Friedmanniella luteola]SDT11043.1 GAF domain-containing protein [Friedmanniella luteola]